MTVVLKNTFFAHSRALTFKDSASVTWALNVNTNELSATGGSGATGANPTAKVGLAAVNGSAPTFTRSDGSPALDQAISPTWSGVHTFAPPSGTPVVISIASAASLLSFKGAAGIGVFVDFFANGASSRQGLLGAPGVGGGFAAGANVGDMVLRAENGSVLVSCDGGTTTQLKISNGGSVFAGKFAINNGTPTAQLAGFGSPSGTPTSGLTSAATLAQTAGTLAALLAYLKSIGFLGA